MCDTHRREFMAKSLLALGALAAVSATALASAQQPATGGKKWICPPCGCPSDGKEFDAGGLCPSCGMPLIEKPAAAQPATPSTVPAPAAGAAPAHAPAASPTPPK